MISLMVSVLCICVVESKNVTSEKKNPFIFTGTKWCGHGNVASHYDDLGTSVTHFLDDKNTQYTYDSKNILIFYHSMNQLLIVMLSLVSSEYASSNPRKDRTRWQTLPDWFQRSVPVRSLLSYVHLIEIPWDTCYLKGDERSWERVMEPRLRTRRCLSPISQLTSFQKDWITLRRL